MTLDTSTFDGPLVGNRYRLGRRLGSGGQGTTHLAYDTRAENRVAVKTLNLKNLRDWKALDLFRREAAVLKACQHPGIPRFVDEVNDEANGQMHLVMEHVPGQTLEQRVKLEGALPEAELWRILVQVADVLAYLHGRDPPVIHRDIKPGNLVQRPDGSLALVDFGTVHQKELEQGGNTFVGTAGFMAPEQLHGDAVPATDLYGLGATLAALGCGVAPEDLPRDGLRLKYAERMNASPALRELMDRMLEPEPQKRMRSGVELKRILDDKTRMVPRAADDAEGPSDGDEADGDAPGGLVGWVPPGVAGLLGMFIGVAGMAMSIGLLLIDRVLLPVVFMILGAAMPDKKDKLRKAEDVAHQVARQAMVGVREVGTTLLKEGRRSRKQARLEGAQEKGQRRELKEQRREDRKFREREERARQVAARQRDAQRQGRR